MKLHARPRYLGATVRKDLQKKMVFIAGPRQVGKTTLALSLLGAGDESHPGYLNWDDPHTRPALLRGEIPSHQPLLVLDEIHKFRRWRSLLKGLYDTHRSTVRFLVTGSARLDVYRKGGESLQGRYHHYRLHPFSLRELAADPRAQDVEHLLRFGGFPEPALSGEERTWRRWNRERLDRVVHQDIRDLENVRDLGLIELLAEELPNRVGSPLSVGSLKNLLQVAHETVERWLAILEAMYLCFRLPPHGAPRIRAVRKERKLYLYDWSQVPDAGARFENLVASQLLKYCHYEEDREGHRMELRYLRDTDKREVDFVVLRNRKPLFAVECKTGPKAVSPAARYFRSRTDIPRFYQVHLGDRDFGDAENDVRVLPFLRFCSELEMP
jgi:predicted AAA+ superfamily ATPase